MPGETPGVARREDLPPDLVQAVFALDGAERKVRMIGTATKAALSPERQRLVELMQRIGFGRIEGLAVKDGQPVFDPAPRIVRDVKFCSGHGPRPEASLEDFALKAQVIDLFAGLREMGTGTVLVLEVHHGLPFRMQVEVAHA